MKNYLKDREIQESLKKIESYKNSADNSLYDLNNIQTVKIDIKIDNSLNHGEFINDKENSHIWYATSQTFRAMKKDLFSLDEEDLDLQQTIICTSCNTKLDKQFWIFCPYCTKSF